MNPQLQMFAQNIRLLIGLLVCAVIGLGLLVLSWTVFRAYRFNRRLKRAEETLSGGPRAPGGADVPPRAPGVCHRCARVDEAVYHLPTGERVCPACYATESRDRRGAGPSAAPRVD